MRYIDISKLRASITAEWAATAAALTGELSRAADKDERKNILNRPASADAWRDLKVYLEQISSNKCWYCESRQIRSDNAVDHFRPKGRVFECDDHPGYWWLAFNWENYRFSCTFCNSRRTDVITDATGGKHDHFPLAREDQRVYSDKEDIRRELPMLLDPVNPADYGLIWF